MTGVSGSITSSARPLRILVIVARDPRHPHSGGGDHHMAHLAGQLGRAGHRVEVWTSTVPAQPRRERVEGVEIRRVAPTRLLAPAVWGLLLTGQARRFDLVLEEAIGGERLPFLGVLLGRRPTIAMWYQDNRPLFAASYGALGQALAAAWQSMLLRFYRDHGFVVPSEAPRAWLIGQGVRAERIAICHPTVNRPEARGAPRGFDGRANRFVCIGKFQPLKRFEEAIEVLERLSDSVPDAQLAIMGREDDTTYLDSIRARIARSSARARVTLLLNAPEPSKFELLESAKALTIHSPIEGFAWTVPEAGLCGVPVVANTGTPGTTVREGENGRKVAVGDVGAYVAILEEWMADRPVWERFSAGARRIAREFTDPELPAGVAELVVRTAHPR